MAADDLRDSLAPSSLVGEGWGGGGVANTVAGSLLPSRRAARGDLPHKGGGKPSGESAASNDGLSVGAILSLAYPDRVAKNRGGGSGLFLLANGRGAALDPASSLSRAPYIVVADMTGIAAQARILLAAAMTQEEIERRFADEIESRDDVTFDPQSLSLRATKSRKLGAIALAEQRAAVVPGEETARIFAEGIAKVGLDRLPWTKAILQWRDRVMFLRKSEGDEWPDLSDQGLAQRAEEWLVPLLADKTKVSEIDAGELSAALTTLLPWTLRRRLEEEAPTHFEAPTGTNAAIDYEAEAGPTISIRLQELFGLAQHPSIAGGRVPLVIELLSPAHRPVQVTRDLPGFWRGSYQAVKIEMKGRYPRHPWPDDPLAALPTRRAKPRGT